MTTVELRLTWRDGLEARLPYSIPTWAIPRLHEQVRIELPRFDQVGPGHAAGNVAAIGWDYTYDQPVLRIALTDVHDVE